MTKHAIFWISTKPHEVGLADRLEPVLQRDGYRTERRPVGSWDPYQEHGDLGIVVGIHATREKVCDCYTEQGIPYLHLDKGYTRSGSGEAGLKTEYWRVSVDSHQPTDYLHRLMLAGLSRERAKILGWRFKSWKFNEEGPVVYCAPSGRSIGWHGYGASEEGVWAGDVNKLRKAWGPAVRVIFRPKPARYKVLQAWQVPSGVILDDGKAPLTTVLRGARCLVTWASAACLDAVLSGVPSVVLGHAVGGIISARDFGELETPEPRIVHAWLDALAHCQFSWDEMASGEMWQIVRDVIMPAARGG